MPARPNAPLPTRLVKFDLNSDLGENEPRKLTAALMRYITSANIACGGHAGDVESMRTTVDLSLKHKVHIGAHPGLPDRANFGRGSVKISVADFKTLVLQQISALERIVHDAGATLHHIKLHGALYHMVEEKPVVCRAYLEMVQEFWPNVIIFSFAGGTVAKAAAKNQIPSWGEGFLDRGYYDKQRLVRRGEPGSLLTMEEFSARLNSLREKGTITAVFPEQSLRLAAKTWCIHSDTPDALQFAKLAREKLISSES